MKFSVNPGVSGEIKIYTLSGKLVRKLRGESGAGEVSWNGRNEAGEKVDRGVYIYALTSGGETKKGKIAITK